MTAVQEDVSNTFNNDDERDRLTESPEDQLLVTLAVDPSEAERIIFTAEFGLVWLGAERSTVPDTDDPIITRGNVYQSECSEMSGLTIVSNDGLATRLARLDGRQAVRRVWEHGRIPTHAGTICAADPMVVAIGADDLSTMTSTRSASDRHSPTRDRRRRFRTRPTPTKRSTCSASVPVRYSTNEWSESRASDAIDRVFALGQRASLERPPEEHRHRLITVLSPKGGTGKTTLSKTWRSGWPGMPNQVLLIDLDLQFGDVASALVLIRTTREGCHRSPASRSDLAQGLPHQGESASGRSC